MSAQKQAAADRVCVPHTPDAPAVLSVAHLLQEVQAGLAPVHSFSLPLSVFLSNPAAHSTTHLQQ